MKYGLYAFAFVVFIVSAFFIITYAAGYKVDITSRKLLPTGLVSISTDRSNEVYLGDELLGTGKVIRRNLEPGNYKITVKREGYSSWSKDFELDAGEAESYENIVLFKNLPEISEYQTNQPDFFSKLTDASNLYLVNNEIFQNDQFVTRYSQPVYGLTWYPDENHISFTNEGKLKIVDLDGSNEVNLLDKNSQTTAVFINSGRSVVYENAGKVYRADIR